jgi:ankyrin repeat protein
MRPLYFCAFNKRGAAMTALLLQHGANASGFDSGEAPLMGAAISGDVSSGRVLIDAGADAAVVTSDGFTCLHAAALSKRQRCCSCCWSAGEQQ